MKELQLDQCFRFVSEIVKTIRSTSQYEHVLHLVVDRIFRLYGCQTCAVILIDPKTEYLRVENCCGLSLTFCNAFRRRIAAASIGRLLWTGKPILIVDRENDPILADEVQLESRFASCACVQIAADHRTLGYLHVDSKDTQAFTEKDVELLQMFADFAALAVYKFHLQEENLHLDRTDHETGLEKYGPFLDKVAVSMERAKDFNEGFAIAILDIDNFKSAVNTYGYDASRQLLKELGDLLKTHLRTVDSGGRYGYDEFILLMANTGLEDAVARAKRMRLAIEGMTFTPQAIRSSVSIGVAAYPDNGRSIEQVLLTAKKAVFEAQREGRNNVFAFREDWYTRNGSPVGA